MQVAETFKLDEIFAKLGGLDRVALAVSGGSDSTAMLRMVHEWASALQQPPQVFVLTVDHGLREAAAAETRQVAEWCAVLKISHEILRWQHDGVKTGIQAKARTARYNLMSEWCTAHGIKVLLTAHTADDQAETVAMRKERTSSLLSIAGIWPEREWCGIRVLRPLLQMRRLDLRNYLITVGQDWIEDASNNDRQFERVRVRQELGGNAEVLAAEAGTALEKVKATATLADIWWTSNIDVNEFGFATFSRSSFIALQDAIQDAALVQLLSVVGGGGQAELAERQRLADWLNAAESGRRVLGGVMFAKQTNYILAGREPGRIAAGAVIIPKSGHIVWDNRFELEGPIGAAVVSVATLKGVERHRRIPAFVQAGLPAIVQNGQIWSIPHLGIGNDVFVKFLRH